MLKSIKAYFRKRREQKELHLRMWCIKHAYSNSAELSPKVAQAIYDWVTIKPQ